MTSFSFSNNKVGKKEKLAAAFKQHLHAEKRSRDKRLLKETVAASQKRHTQWAMNSQLMKTKDVSQPTRWFVGSHVSSLRKNFCMCQIIWYDSRNDENAMSPWSQFHLFLVFLSSSSPLLLTKAASQRLVVEENDIRIFLSLIFITFSLFQLWPFSSYSWP